MSEAKLNSYGAVWWALSLGLGLPAASQQCACDYDNKRAGQRAKAR